jgi:DNA modification methylase
MDKFINKVIMGDCLEVMKGIPDKSVDMVLTSPPYDNLRDYKGYTFNFEGIAKEIYRVLKDGGVCVWVVGDATIKGSETGTSFKQALYFKEVGFNLHDTMIYEKSTSPFPMHTRCNQLFEYMFIFSKGKPKTFNPIKIPTITGGQKKSKDGGYRQKDGTIKLAGYKTRKMTKTIGNIWRYSVGGKGNNHPATFPEKLAEDHILSWSNEGDIILDPMAGSGTTLKMAKKNNRNYIGIEIAPEYIDIINKRLN